VRKRATLPQRVAVFGLLFVSQASFAAPAPDATAAEPVESVIPGLIVNLVPLFLIFAVFFVIIRAYRKRYGSYMERASLHMDRLEQNTARIITILEEISKEIKTRDR